jgi:hypothetical protein
MQRKLAELDEQIASAQAARQAISHGLRCPHQDITQCPNFTAGITARLDGQPLSQSHQQLHGQRFGESPGLARRPPRWPAGSRPCCDRKRPGDRHDPGSLLS